MLDPILISDALEERATAGRFAMSIGSTNVCFDEYLFETMEENGDEPYCLGELDLDSYFVAGAAHAEAPKGISAEQLSKVWKIDLDLAKNTLDVAMQNCKRVKDPSLSRNYSTNDRMLRYKRIAQFFFMDNFFATRRNLENRPKGTPAVRFSYLTKASIS